MSAPAHVAEGPAARAGDTGRSPGRPRDEELDDRILGAALGIVDEGSPLTVSTLVEASGVSRAAIYRRWPSLTDLVLAALDHGRTIPPELPDTGDIRTEFMEYFLGTYAQSAEAYPDRRFRARIRILMADQDLQRRYWEERVEPRRAPLLRAFDRAIARGELRHDLDVWAAIDLLIGVLYYQIIVRGEHPNAPAPRARIEAAVEIVWRGMLADPQRMNLD